MEKQYKLFDSNFYARKDFLIAFSGKFFGKAISARTDIKMEDYYKFAVDNTDFTKFPDFIELVDLIK